MKINKNPFKEEDGTVNYESLISGEKYENKKAYKGFPDLLVDEQAINDPSLNQDTSPTSDLDFEADGATYGHATNDYRSKIPDLKGKHVNEDSLGNGSSEVLGQYFRKNYIEIE